MAKKNLPKMDKTEKITYTFNGESKTAQGIKMTPLQILASNKINAENFTLVCIKSKTNKQAYNTYPLQNALVRVSGKTFITEATTKPIEQMPKVSDTQTINKTDVGNIEDVLNIKTETK